MGPTRSGPTHSSTCVACDEIKADSVHSKLGNGNNKARYLPYCSLSLLWRTYNLFDKIALKMEEAEKIEMSAMVS